MLYISFCTVSRKIIQIEDNSADQFLIEPWGLCANDKAPMVNMLYFRPIGQFVQSKSREDGTQYKLNDRGETIEEVIKQDRCRLSHSLGIKSRKI